MFAIEWHEQVSTTTVSLRSLGAVNNRVCWAGGAEGTVLTQGSMEEIRKDERVIEAYFGQGAAHRKATA